MTRIPRLQLILCILAIVVLVSAPLASAGPRETSWAAHRTDDGWFGAALSWLEDLIGLHGSAPGRTSELPGPAQKSKLPGPTGSSCLDPYGHPKPWCL